MKEARVRRKRLRLMGYDYSLPSAYFVTVCVHNKECLFGEIVERGMILNDAGKMISEYWGFLPGRFPGVALDVFMVMPNHFHGIIIITGSDLPHKIVGADHFKNIVGADQRVCPKPGADHHQNIVGADHFKNIVGADHHQNIVGADQRVCPKPGADHHQNIVGADHRQNIVGADQRVCPKTDEHIGSPLPNSGARIDNKTDEHIGSPLPRIIQWFKTMTTNQYIRGVKEKNWTPFSGKLWQRNYYEHIVRNEESLNRIREYIMNNSFKWDDDLENPGRVSQCKASDYYKHLI